MNPAELDNYIAKALTVIKKTLYDLKPELMENYGVIEHEKKADKSAVTRLDKHVETVLKTALSKIDPRVGFYGEEFGIDGNTEVYWLIDPIDGTEAFIRGMPFCSNMLCLVNGEALATSVIYNFPLDEMFIAIAGRGATCNDKKITVSERKIDHASIEFEIRRDSKRNHALYFGLPRYSVLKFSAAGFGFSQVAKGAIEARVQYDGYGKLWDYAPGALLVSEAGGRVANMGSNIFEYNNLDFIASNQAVHEDLQNYFVNNNK